MNAQVQSPSNLYALLIGIDCYLPNRLPGGSYYPSLGGCVRDINHVEEFLSRKLGLAPDHILKLTASNRWGSKEPAEDQSQWPTYENMVKKFQELTDMAGPGDQVYIHYSGHGGRASTVFPDIKGSTGLDEALVPTDIGNSEARYLRDVEMAHLLQKMVDKGLIVTVVFDSCHSGGATRGEGKAVARGIGVVDTTVRPTDSLVASPEDLASTWQGQTSGGTRSLKTGGGWLLEPKGYTLLAACRAAESAMEFPFDGSESNGALTYWLLDSLKQIGPGLTYKMLHDRILAKVHSQFETQTPQLQGEGNRVVFGSDAVQPQFATPVLQVSESGNQVLLNAGQAHGLRKGAQFAIYPSSTSDFAAGDERLALAEITDLGAAESWAAITNRLRSQEIEQGAQAVLLDPGSSRLRRSVRVFQRSDLPADVNQEKALERVEEAITTGENSFVRIAAEQEPADFQVVVNDRNQYEIWDAAGVPLSNLRPALAVDKSSSPQKLAARLVHLAKYRNVQELDNHDSMSPLARKLVVELVGWQPDFDPVETPEPRPFDDPGQTPTIQDGEWVFLRIRNALSPGQADDPSRILNVTVLDLQPDWGISQIYPSGSGLFEPLDPGQEIILPLHAKLPRGYREGTDILKVFATTTTTNFRWLELPVLDKPSVPKLSHSPGRGASADPLEELLTSVTMMAPTTRNLNIAAYPSREWITAQVEVRMKAEAVQN